MKTKIQNYIRAGYSGLFITTVEENRVQAEIAASASDLKFECYAWTCVEGLVNLESGELVQGTEEADVMLSQLGELPEKSVIIAKDFHLFIGESNPFMIRKLKDALAIAKQSNRVLVALGHHLALAPELEKEFTVMEYELPSRDELREVMNSIADVAEVKVNGKADAVLDAASGLTTMEAENAFSISVVERKGIEADVVAREKSATVKKNGILEIVPAELSLEDIGGLDLLKDDLASKRNLFSKAAREYGLPTPRGCLIVGQPGTGKSMTAKAAAATFGLPLLRLEAGRLFGGIVGETERNWRTAFGVARAIAPCVLWIDEVDGLFVGGESSGKTDGGTTARVIKTILQDMQDASESIMWMLTANDIDGCPDPLIDRLDVWNVDLPDQDDREQIWALQFAKLPGKCAGLDAAELAEATDGFSGRQIEQAFWKGATISFNADEAKLDAQHMQDALRNFVPTSKTMAVQIEARRKRLEGRAMSASTKAVKQSKKGRKLVKG